jgi:hypothetical protein
MAISVSFNGSTIYKPGGYSDSTIDLGGNVPLGPAGLVAIVGEADAGTPGASEVDASRVFYTADRLTEARAKYRSGPIVDALAFLFSPASDGAIPSGAQTVWVYKTNASTRASLALAASYGTVRAEEWGTGGNRVTYKNVLANAGQAESTGGTIASFGATLDAASFSYRYNGGASTIVTLGSGSHANIGALVSELNGLPAFSTNLVASNVGSALVIKTVVDANLYTEGRSETFELIDSSPGDLALLGLTAGLKVPAAEPTASITLNNRRDNIVETDTVGGHAVIAIGRDSSGGATTASVSVSATSVTLTDSVGATTLTKSDYVTLKQLAEAISLASGWSASVTNSVYNQISPNLLDLATTVGAFSTSGAKPARIKKDAFEVQDLFNQSGMCDLVDPASTGLPAALTETFLAGGAKGATLSVDVVDGLAKLEKFHVNSLVPLFSRDATADAADSLTEATSTYTIDGIHQAIKTHISMMKTVKKRSERQGYLSLKADYETCRSKAGDLADARLQLAIQDIRQIDAAGTIKWFQPWALSSLMAGARGGSPIGTPLTFKFLNCSGIRQTGQAMTTAEEDVVLDFDPDTQYDDAIQGGITFLESPQTGGFRVVVDNTTYGIDDNWVYNRGNVIYAADIVAFNFRNTMEARYVGKKNTVRAAEVKSTAESVLATFLAQGITVATSDAPQGFKDLSVRIDGNTIYITVTVKLVEGIDFVLSEIALQRATQTA